MKSLLLVSCLLGIGTWHAAAQEEDKSGNHYRVTLFNAWEGPELFVRVKKSYERLEAFRMAYTKPFRYSTDQPIIFYVKVVTEDGEEDYQPFLKIPVPPMVLQPMLVLHWNEKDAKGGGKVVEFSPRKFPYGSYQVVNLSHARIAGYIGDQKKKFSCKAGGEYISPANFVNKARTPIAAYSEGALAVVEGQEAFHGEVDGGGDMEDVGEAVADGGGVGGAEPLGDLVDVGPIDGEDFEDAEGEIGLEVAQHDGGLALAEAFGAVVFKEAHVEAGGLAEFEEQQGGNRDRPRVPVNPGIRLWRKPLFPVPGTEEGGVGEVFHGHLIQPCSPSNSYSRMALTSSSEKQRSPQMALRRAAVSGLAGGGLVAVAACIGVSKATGVPRFSIWMVSPSASQASSERKSLRRSRTVAVFMWTGYVHMKFCPEFRSAIRGFQPQVTQRTRMPGLCFFGTVVLGKTN